MVSPIGCNQLCFISNKLIVDFLHLHKKILYNKMGWCVWITWMEKAFSLFEYGMEVIGHKDPISYDKYVLIFLFFEFSVLFFLKWVVFLCKYNKINKHLCDRVMQWIIYGEIRYGWLVAISKKLSTRKMPPMKELRYVN